MRGVRPRAGSEPAAAGCRAAWPRRRPRSPGRRAGSGRAPAGSGPRVRAPAFRSGRSRTPRRRPRAGRAPRAAVPPGSRGRTRPRGRAARRGSAAFRRGWPGAARRPGARPDGCGDRRRPPAPAGAGSERSSSRPYETITREAGSGIPAAAAVGSPLRGAFVWPPSAAAGQKAGAPSPGSRARRPAQRPAHPVAAATKPTVAGYGTDWRISGHARQAGTD